MTLWGWKITFKLVEHRMCSSWHNSNEIKIWFLSLHSLKYLFSKVCISKVSWLRCSSQSESSSRLEVLKLRHVISACLLPARSYTKFFWCVIPCLRARRRSEVPGVLGLDPAWSEDRVWRGHPGRALPSAHQGQEEAMLTAVNGKTEVNTEREEEKKRVAERCNEFCRESRRGHQDSLVFFLWILWRVLITNSTADQ